MESMGDKRMKQYKRLATLLSISSLMLFLLSSVFLTVFASDSRNELVRQIEGALDVSAFYEKEAERLIKCFDVNEDGSYAIGYKNNTIHVYDSLGAFQYGYRFNTEGTYGIVLKENSIVLYLGRSGIAVEIDPAGNCIDAEKVYLSKDIVDNVMNRTYKQIANADYCLERDIGIFNGDYSRLVKIDEDENKVILYDVTTRGYFTGVFHYIILGVFPLWAIVCICAKAKEEKRASDE